MRVFDAWMQPPARRFLTDPIFASLTRWLNIDPATLPESFPPDFLLHAMDAAGVERATVSAWHGPSGVIISNAEIAALVKAHPDRLVGLASVDLARPMEAVRELRRAVEFDDARGLRLLPWLWNLPPNDRRYYPLYAACVDLGIPFCTQAGHAGPLCESEPGRPIPYLDQVALEFPELVIVAGHTGFPWTQELIALAMKYPNLYIDTSAYKPSRYPRELIDYMRASGCKKVLFASDFPMLTPAACLAEVGQLQLTDEARARFLYGNATHIFRA